MPIDRTKVALVIQRYGLDVIGGAELHARQLAERFVSDLGWDVDVFTTCARSYQTWANELPPGEEVLNGVRIRRFRTRIPRAPFFGGFDRLTAPLLRALWPHQWGRAVALVIEWIWIILQGPYSPTLVRSLVKDAGRYRKVIFMTYLYYPTLAGMAKLAQRSILIPLAHDEHPFRFVAVSRLFRRCRQVLANTEPELNLIRPRFDGTPRRVDVAGIGFDDVGLLSQPKPKKPASEPRYVLYLGRIGRGKGVDNLVQWFLKFAQRRNDGIRLVLAGHVEDGFSIPNDPRIEYRGYVDDKQKISLLNDAAALVNPSPHESLSMIVIEAMALGIPVLVNRHCEVLRYYTEQTSTVFGFGGESEFDEALGRVLATNWTDGNSATAIAMTRDWALSRFSWRRVLDTFRAHVEDLPT